MFIRLKNLKLKQNFTKSSFELTWINDKNAIRSVFKQNKIHYGVQDIVFIQNLHKKLNNK